MEGLGIFAKLDPFSGQREPSPAYLTSRLLPDRARGKLLHSRNSGIQLHNKLDHALSTMKVAATVWGMA